MRMYHMYLVTFLLNPLMAAGCFTIAIIKTRASMPFRYLVIFGPMQRWTPCVDTSVLQLCQAFGGGCQHGEGRCFQQFLAEELCCSFAAGEYFAEPGTRTEAAVLSHKKRKTTG